MKSRNSFALIASIICAFCGTAFSQTPCKLETGQQVWIDQALTEWKTVRRDSLHLPPDRSPWLILFDARCVIHVNPDIRILGAGTTPDSKPTKLKLAGEAVDIVVASHNGKISLPSGGEVPAQLLSFAAPYDNGKKSFLISALPSIWQSASHLKDEPNTENLATSVFVHEMTHTLHRNFYGRLDEIEKRLNKSDEIDDDIIQSKYEKVDAFRSSVESEKKLLFQAAAATDRAEQKRLAKQALSEITERRKTYFTGESADFAGLEEVFLTMEGVANWAAYQAAVNQGLSTPAALNLIRRGGKYWSQDEGLALFLVIDVLLPGWQRRAFAEKNATALELLRDAVR